jgi:hypothetical protein
VVTNNKDPQTLCIHNAKKDRVRETVDQAATNASRNYTELGWSRENSLNRCVDLDPKFVSEPRLLSIVVRDRAVEV